MRSILPVLALFALLLTTGCGQHSTTNGDKPATDYSGAYTSDLGPITLARNVDGSYEITGAYTAHVDHIGNDAGGAFAGTATTLDSTKTHMVGVLSHQLGASYLVFLLDGVEHTLHLPAA